MALKTPKEQVLTDLAILFSKDLPGVETVTYNGSDILGIIDYGGKGYGESARTAILGIKVSDVPDPAYRDTAVINGVTWRVYQDQSQEVVIQGNGFTWKLPITRDERPQW